GRGGSWPAGCSLGSSAQWSLLRQWVGRIDASAACGSNALLPLRAGRVPAGSPKVRSNDNDYRFRPGSDHYWLTGHTEPGGVLLLRAAGEGHDAALYLEPRSDRSPPAF